MENYQEVKLEELDINPWETIGNDWLVVSAGGKKRQNAMTASWGSFGIMWGKKVVTIVLRPQRYTRGFVEKKGTFSISVLKDTPENREGMKYIGTVSGRDEDKMTKAGLSFEMFDKLPAIKDAELVLECRVIYRGRVEKDEFIEKGLVKECYPEKDYHFVYVAEIEKAYKRQD